MTSHPSPSSRSNQHVSPSEDPDVTIVVGMQEFEEHSRELCCWSDYFHAALVRSGMTESISRRFEFPDRDPDQWELIRSMVMPFATTKVTIENVQIALSWFDELLCKGGLQECDRVLKANVLSALHPEKQTSRDQESMKENVDMFLDTLSTSVQYRLEESKQTCIAVILRVFEEAPEALNEEHLKTVLSFLDQDEDCESLFWNPVKRFLPASLSNSDKQDLIQNECLPSLISSQIQKELAERRLGRLFQVSDWAASARTNFRERVKDDPLLSDAAPRSW